MKRKEKIKFLRDAKIKGNVLKLLYVLLILSLVYNVIYLINTTITKKDYLSVFGISFFNIDTNSMKKTLNKNDLVITKQCNVDNLEKEDIIAYVVNGEVRINKIINIYNENNTGNRKIITKSDSNYYPDVEPIVENQVIGKKVLKLPFLGGITKLLETKISSVFSIIILCLMFSYNKYTYRVQMERRRKKKKRQLKNEEA